jgi:hypothetical protein
MFLRIPLAMASLLWTAGDIGRSPVAAGQVRIVADSFYRCSREATLNTFLSLVFRFETNRALAFLRENECGFLAKGELATVEVVAPSAEVACVRLLSDRKCAWVPTSVLR